MTKKERIFRFLMGYLSVNIIGYLSYSFTHFRFCNLIPTTFDGRCMFLMAQIVAIIIGVLCSIE